MQDGAASQSTASGTIMVSGVNDAPVANTDNVTIIEDTPTLINLTGNDTDADGPGSQLAINSIDGTTITFSGQTVNVAGGIVTVPANPVTGVLNRVSFAPTANNTAPSSFQYTIKDGLGAVSNIGTVNVTMTPVNDAPVANAGSARSRRTEDTALANSRARPTTRRGGRRAVHDHDSSMALRCHSGQLVAVTGGTVPGTRSSR